MRVYCYSKCSTCKKALAWLDENDVSYELLDIKTNHPGLAELAAACLLYTSPSPRDTR